MSFHKSFVEPGVTLPLGNDRGIVLLHRLPTGQSEGPTYLAAAEANRVIVDAGVSGATGSAVWTLGTDGYAWGTGSYTTFFSCTLPAKATSFRRFEMVCKSKDAALTAWQGTRIAFNYADGNNYWSALASWHSSGYLQIALYEITGGVGTLRGNSNLPAAVGVPMNLTWGVLDMGDHVAIYANAFEEDSPADFDQAKVEYYVASRPHKTSNFALFGSDQSPGDEWLIRSVMVEDV